jgi:hypothetical protein
MGIRYAGDGTVRSEDIQFSREIENVLNLNWARLKLNRKAVTESVIQVLSRNRGPGMVCCSVHLRHPR